MSDDARPTEAKPAEKPIERTSNGRFALGNSGGPGRPRATFNEYASAMDQLAVEAAPELMEAVLKKARDGDMKALQFVLARVWPARKGRPVEIAALPIRNKYSLTCAQIGVTDAMMLGDVSPEEGAVVSAVLEAQQRMFDLGYNLHHPEDEEQ